MKRFIVYIAFSLVFGSCHQNKRVKILSGYIVYILPNNIRFVETKNTPSTDYEKNFESENFKLGMSFRPNCFVEEMINTIKPDTLLDENPDLKEFTTFMKKPMIFPAKLIVYDTANEVSTETKKFKMLYHGKNVEFNYTPFNGIVVDLKRFQ
jgi:hypothetical protein